MEIKTLVEIRGGRVRIQERDNETTVTIAHEGGVDTGVYEEMLRAQTATEVYRKKAEELATALDESRALVDQRDKALDEAVKNHDTDHRLVVTLRRELDAEKEARLATVRRIGEVERALVNSEKRADDLENALAEEKRQREMNKEWAERAEKRVAEKSAIVTEVKIERDKARSTVAKIQEVTERKSVQEALNVWGVPKRTEDLQKAVKSIQEVLGTVESPLPGPRKA